MLRGKSRFESGKGGSGGERTRSGEGRDKHKRKSKIPDFGQTTNSCLCVLLNFFSSLWSTLSPLNYSARAGDHDHRATASRHGLCLCQHCLCVWHRQGEGESRQAPAGVPFVAFILFLKKNVSIYTLKLMRHSFCPFI